MCLFLDPERPATVAGNDFQWWRNWDLNPTDDVVNTLKNVNTRPRHVDIILTRVAMNHSPSRKEREIHLPYLFLMCAKSFSAVIDKA